MAAAVVVVGVVVAEEVPLVGVVGLHGEVIGEVTVAVGGDSTLTRSKGATILSLDLVRTVKSVAAHSFDC